MKAARMLSFVCILCSGCQMTCGIYLQKDWKTEPCYPIPDMHTQAKIEMVKDWK